jgi:hypothetical protein
VNEAVIVSPFVNLSGVTTIAGATSLAVYNNLSAKSNWSVSLKVVQDVESISDSGG